MAQRKTAAVIRAAGKGTRMKSALPKVMHPLAGCPMIRHLLASVSAAKLDRAVVVVGPEMESVAKAVAPAPAVVQKDRLGTGHAVLCAKDALKGFGGDALVLYGDTPLLTPETLRRVMAARRKGAAVVVLGFEPADPGAYGRLVLGAKGDLEAIVEYKDANPQQRAIRLCNSGVMAADAKLLFTLLSKVRNDNAKGEYYLTDVVGLARKKGRAARRQFTRRAGRGRSGDPNAAAQPRDGGRRDLDRSVIGFLLRRHQARPGRDDRSQRCLRPRRDRGGRR
jgi:bifunctional UDP-N-acetylglucosamine pyrophosphorylase / glucosamine-1-phosphate N-acetyltransferase